MYVYIDEVAQIHALVKSWEGLPITIGTEKVD